MDHDDNPHKPISYASKGGGHNHEATSHYEFKNLTGPELAALDAALLGANWVRVMEGRLQFAGAYETPPKPTPDPDVGPYWQEKWNQKRRKDHKVRVFDPDAPGFSEPGLFVSHLGAGNSREGAYEANVERMERWGFECLRSRRGEDGKYWEIWYLPSLFFAEAELAVAIAAVRGKHGDKEFQKGRADAAISFLCRNCNFGTLDLFIQRAALTYD